MVTRSWDAIKYSVGDNRASMKWLWTILSVMILLLQVRLWTGEGSLVRAWQLEHRISQQKAANAKLAARNARMVAEVNDLRGGNGAIEERARMNLGMIKKGETFYLVVNH